MRQEQTEHQTVWMGKDFKEKLQRLAAELNISVSAYVRMAITTFEKMGSDK